MQTLFVPKYGIHYRVNPKNPCELQWSKKPFGPMTSWQKAFTFKAPIRALDIDDTTGQGVVVLNDSSTYVGSGVRVWGRKFYTAGSRIYSLYAIGESKMNSKLKIRVHENVSEAYNPKSKKIGRYVWSLENLNIDDGDYGVYKNPSTGEVFYTYDAAKRVAESIPGWHLPTPDEWADLEDALFDGQMTDDDYAVNEFEVKSFVECSNISGSYKEPNLKFYDSDAVNFWSSQLPIIADVSNETGLGVITSKDTYGDLRYEGFPVRLVKG